MFENRASQFNLRDSNPVVPVAQILGALSYALDLTEGQPEGHCLRSCWIGIKIGEAIGLPADALGDLYYTLLLKDLGCSSNAARISELYLADDRNFKHDFKLLDSGLLNVLTFVFTRTGVHSPMKQRIAAVSNILKNGSAIARDLIAARCTRGADIARQLRFSEEVATGIRHLDEHWDGGGKPLGLAGDAIALFARIALLAQVADVQFMANGIDAARAEVQRQSGRWFDPQLVDTFLSLSRNPQFWATLQSKKLDRMVMQHEAGEKLMIADESYLDDIACAFGQIIDAKSPYTAGHSTRVGDYTDQISKALGYNARARTDLRRAAILHDIGKLGVSNTILDKPGKLDESEWQVMREHASSTSRILGRISVFGDMAMIAGSHHERLDGAGYPLQLDKQTISMDTRIITICDFYDALTADRPYRAAMPVEKALSIIRAEVGGAVDPACFAALENMVSQGEAIAAS